MVTLGWVFLGLAVIVVGLVLALTLALCAVAADGDDAMARYIDDAMATDQVSELRELERDL